MDVLTLYEALNPAGAIVSKGGGEFCGPCPNCGGRDRFLLWPEHSSGATGGRFLCRGCGVQGDAVEFLREFRGLSYAEACDELRIAPSRRTGPTLGNSTARAESRREWTPSPERLPSAGWMQRAAAFVRGCSAGIESGDGLAYLQSRGLTVETARKLGIGWNPADRYDRRSDWGLEDELNPETGRFRKVWLPRGLTLPIRRKAGVVAVLIRRADWKPDDDAPKYWQVKGSGNGCCCLGAAGKPVVVVESLLDAVLVWQEAGDAAAVALTGASKRPDAGTAAFLRAAPLVLWALDFDGPGRKEWPWWKEHFQAVKCPPLAGKDPGDMQQAGIPIRLWIEAGIAEAAPESRERARQDEEAPPLPGGSETPADATCSTNRSKSEPRAESEANGPENPILTAPNEAVQSMDTLEDAAVDCPQYPSGCLACSEYRGLTRWWCRRLHWWKPWPTPEGELPVVEIRRGHVQHVYSDGTTRLVGVAAAPTAPASMISPLPIEASTMQETKASRWHKATREAAC